MTLTGFARRRRLAAAKLAQAEALAAEEAKRLAAEAIADAEPKPAPLSKLNKPALEALAIEQGIDPAGMTKAQIIEALSSAPPAPTDPPGGEQSETSDSDREDDGPQGEGDDEDDKVSSQDSQE